MKKIISLMLTVLMASISNAQEINGTWKGVLNAGNQKLEIVFHFNHQKDGNSTAEMDVPAQGALGIPVNLKLLSTDSVSLEVLALLMAYTGKLTDGTIKGTFNQFGRPFPLDLKPGEAAKPNRPQEPELPLGYNTKEVTFANQDAGVSLSGTLTYPVGYVSNFIM